MQGALVHTGTDHHGPTLGTGNTATPPSASLIPMQRRWSIQTTMSVVMDGGIGRITGNPGQHCDNVTEAFRSAQKELVRKYLWIEGLRSHRR